MKDYTDRPITPLRGRIDQPQPDPPHWSELPTLLLDDRGRIVAARDIASPPKPKRRRARGER